MANSTRKKKSFPIHLEVVEVKTPSHGTQHLQVQDVKELTTELGKLLPQMDLYSVQAVTRLVLHERVEVDGRYWSAKRIGSMIMRPDANDPNESPAARVRAKKEERLERQDRQRVKRPKATELQPDQKTETVAEQSPVEQPVQTQQPQATPNLFAEDKTM